MLPYDGTYYTAVQDDDEMTAASVEKFGAPEPRLRPTLRGWGKADEHAARINERLDMLIAVNVGRGEKPKPTLRPETALDRLEKQKRRESTDWLTQQLFPEGE